MNKISCCLNLLHEAYMVLVCPPRIIHLDTENQDNTLLKEKREERSKKVGDLNHGRGSGERLEMEKNTRVL